MSTKLTVAFAVVFVSLLSGCSNRDKERERERAAEAREKARSAAEKARSAARKLGDEAKQQARNLDSNIHRALQGGSANDNEPTSRAAAKLGDAAITAKVKTRLAADLGFSTATNIDVDVNGGTVTLRGAVPSDDDRKRAEQSVLQVSGVTRVVNNLRVSP